MPSKRTGYAPWSLTREAGVQSATVDGTIEVPQYLQPVIDTGFVDFKGNWKGIPSNDDAFFDFDKHEAIADNGDVLSSKAINMFDHDILMFGIKVSRAGNYTMALIQSGSETGNDSYFNLKPVDTNKQAKATVRTDAGTNAFIAIVDDQEALGNADMWYIFKINDCRGFKLLMKTTNQSGGNSDIETAIMSIV